MIIDTVIIFLFGFILLLLILIKNLMFKKDPAKENTKECFSKAEILTEMINSNQKLDITIRELISNLEEIVNQNKIGMLGEIGKVEEEMKTVSTLLVKMTHKFTSISPQFLTLLSTVEGIHKYINEDARNKDSKLREYESSYNTEIITRLFASRIIETLDFIDYEFKKEVNRGNETLLEIQDDLLRLLSENNIKRLELKENMLFNCSEVKKRFPKVKMFSAETTKKSQHRKIANIKTHGYYKPDKGVDSGKQIVRAAQISVYDFKPSAGKIINQPTTQSSQTTSKL